MSQDWQKDPVRMAAAVKKRARTRRRNLRLHRSNADRVIGQAVARKKHEEGSSLKHVIKELQRRRDALTTTITTLQEVRRG